MDRDFESPRDVRDAMTAGSAMSGPWLPLLDADRRTPYVVIPEGYEVSSIESYLPNPTRKRGHVVLLDADSFIRFTKDEGSMASCRLYVDADHESGRCNIIAILNDHCKTAEWRDYKATFAPKQSLEWKRWIGGNKKSMSQGDFATWIEDNLGDIASVSGMPTGAQMLQLALAFEATAEKRLKSRINLQSGGVRFEYVEDEDKDTRTAMEVFQRFTVGIPVFDGSSDAYPIEARLKYRDNGGKVSFWYELIRPDRAFKTSVNSTIEKIKEATGFMVLFGTP